MQRQDWLSILITAAVGFLTGIFLYTTGGAANYESKLHVPEGKQLQASEFSIVSDVYGGCLLHDVCPSFQVLHDGSYRYFRTPGAGLEQVLRTGILPNDLQKRLRQVVVLAELSQQSLVIEPSFCNSFVDGIDVKYEIILDDTTYLLDSCGTAVVDGGVLWTTLGDIWDYFETGGNN